MKSLWDDNHAKSLNNDPLKLRAYTSNLLGADQDLVMHGGGNTSVKVMEKNILGEEKEILYVKGSGHDLKTMGPEGLSPCDLDYLKRLCTLDSMTDTEMVREMKFSQMIHSAPTPSVEAILHAVIPFKYVDHTHTDAVVTLTNNEKGEEIIRKVYGEDIMILPYTMPGFILAKQIYEATKNVDWNQLRGIVLLNHGVFTFSDDPKVAYENMISIVSEAENHLRENKAWDNQAQGNAELLNSDYLEIASMRKKCMDYYGSAMVTRLKIDSQSVGYSNLPNVAEIATRGPITPDHVIQTKRIPVIIQNENSIDEYVADYKNYFEKNNDGTLTCLDPVPRVGIWKGKGSLIFAPNIKRMNIISDIIDHTIKCVQQGEALGGWKTLTAEQIFELEYWELEQAKLKRGPAKKEWDGKVVLVTGANSGIGKAVTEEFLNNGACVVGLDINPEVENCFDSKAYLGIKTDITNTEEIKNAINKTVLNFGGLDCVVSNAGSFPKSAAVEELDDESWQKAIDLNLTSHLKLMRESIPFLKLGHEPSFMIMASKNVSAPGPGAGAYSVSKAGITQLGRVATMELGKFGIRVNMIHPNAIFDTGVWTDEVLESRAANYGLSVDDYKRNNILKTEITSKDVAKLTRVMAGEAFSKTTGSQVPIDGGNDRVI